MTCFDVMFLYARWTALTSPKTSSTAETRTTPIDTLPIEILILIFEDYCDAWSLDDASSLPQLAIAQVCQHWRSLALDLPTLWTKLVITPQMPSHIVSTYLQRSQQLSLDFEVDLRHEAAEITTHERATTTWKMVKACASRWRRLVLQISPSDITGLSEDLRELRTPQLEELRISSTSHVPGITSILEGGAPALKSLHLVGIPLHRFGPSLEGLTSLKLESNCPMPFPTFRRLTRKMVKLEELTLRGRIVDGWPLYPLEDDTIVLPSLTVLKLSDRRWPLFIPLVSIIAPNLHTLSLYDLVAHDLPETYMESHISNNFPHIRSLVVKGKSAYIDSCNFSQLCRIFPSLEHFALLGVDECFIRDSARSLLEPSIWPKLQAISMTPLPSEDLLCSLISARTMRTTGRPPLKTLAIPIPTQLSRGEWIGQQVRIEECGTPSSPYSSGLASESAFCADLLSKEPSVGDATKVYRLSYL